MRRVAGLIIAGALAATVLGAVPASGASNKATAQVKAKLISLKNLPSGWKTSTLLGSAVSSGKKSAASLGCLAALETAAKGFTPQSVAWASGGEVPIFLELLATGPKPAHAYTLLNQKLAACHTLTISGDGQNLSGTVGPLSFPTVGTASTGYAMTLKSSSISATLDLVVFHAGKYIGGVAYINIIPPKITTVESFVKAAVAKVEGHAVTTPTTYTSSSSSPTTTA